MRLARKFFAIVCAFLVFACASHSVFATDIVATWTGNNPPDSVDYVLQRQIGENWIDVGTTKTETFTVASATMGTWTLRVVARAGPPGDILESLPSNTVVVRVGPNAPKVLSVTLAIP